MPSRLKIWHWVVLAYLGALFTYVAKHVDFPYMDEIFHVKQTLQYVELHDFTTWDPKITTPPGLYIFGFVFAKVFRPSLTVLRATNISAAVLVLLKSSLSQPATARSLSRALLICTFPLFAFYLNLFYTDVWSTVLVLAAMATECPGVSAALLFASLWFRQTNIVWALLTAIFQIFEADTEVKQIFTRFKPLLMKALRKGPSYIVLAVLFAGFLKWNGSIALGDKSNHGFSLHFAQLVYFLAFLSLFSAPILVESIMNEGPQCIKQIFGRRLWLAPLELLAVISIVKYGTVVHPFILADNRHYTFYVWRRLITPLRGYALLPAYWAAWRWFASTVNFKLVRTWAFIASVMLVLVPSPLMEPRYYIVPYLVWRIMLLGRDASSLELLWNMVLNGVTVWVFSASNTHFMW